MKNKIFACILMVCLLIGTVGCAGGNNRRAVGRAAGYDVLYEELRYMTLSVRDLLAERDGEQIWDTAETAEAHRAELEREVSNRIAKEYVVLAAASHYLPNRSLDDKDLQETVDAAVAEAIESLGSKKEYRQFLADLYMTEHLMRFSLAKAQLELELEDALFAETELKDVTAFLGWLAEGNIVWVRQITLPDGADAEAVADALRVGSSPEDAIKADPASVADTKVTKSFLLIRGLAEDPTQETDAFSLERVGDVSTVRKIDGSYRVMIRTEDQLESETFLSYQASAYLKQLRAVRVEKILATFGETVAFTFNDFGKSIDLLKLK